MKHHSMPLPDSETCSRVVNGGSRLMLSMTDMTGSPVKGRAALYTVLIRHARGIAPESTPGSAAEMARGKRFTGRIRPASPVNLRSGDGLRCVSQFAPEYLADVRLRQLGAELDDPRM